MSYCRASKKTQYRNPLFYCISQMLCCVVFCFVLQNEGRSLHQQKGDGSLYCDSFYCCGLAATLSYRQGIPAFWASYSEIDKLGGYCSHYTESRHKLLWTLTRTFSIGFRIHSTIPKEKQKTSEVVCPTLMQSSTVFCDHSLFIFSHCVLL